MSLLNAATVVDDRLLSPTVIQDVLQERKIQELPGYQLHRIAESEEKRQILGVSIGSGALKVLLISGHHSDEPVGLQTLLAFMRYLPLVADIQELLKLWTFVVIPHVNLDGASKNEAWQQDWPDPVSYFSKVYREVPGRDMEFAYPDGRVECSQIADFLKTQAPFDLYLNLHGMAVGDGALLLIDSHWQEQTEALRREWAQAAEQRSLRLHDHDRAGEKGFYYLGPGFSTGPEALAMRNHFLALNQPDMAACFRESSMELVRKISGDSLCIVTEMPLFTVYKELKNFCPRSHTPTLHFRKALSKIASEDEMKNLFAEYQLSPVPLRLAVEMHLYALVLGMHTIMSHHA